VIKCPDAEIKSQVYTLLAKVKQMNFPLVFQQKFLMAHDEKFYTKVYNLDPNSDEFNILKNRLSKNSPEMEILEILRVQNKFSWLCYEREAKNLKSKLG
jgi:hypothetical protein